MDEQLLKEQVDYYRARAGEYDEWFFRTGRYDLGADHRTAWRSEISLVEAALAESIGPGHVLELACGTGLWTRRLVEAGSRVVVVDASPEVIAINQTRVGSGAVQYVQADLFSWVPPIAEFDAAFFGFWLSHVPPARFEAFWTKVRAALKPGGTVFFVDSLLEQTATAKDHDSIDNSGIVRRRLNDGREFHIVKVFHAPAELEHRLAALGWRGQVRTTGRFFLFGSLTSTAA